jgi:quinol monooxygenase YgiN
LSHNQTDEGVTMPTLLVRMQVKAGKAARYEEILRELVKDTKASEPHCLRYEYWRGAEANAYYCLLSFTDTRAFYLHQSSEYHEQYLPELFDMFDGFSIEYVDPIERGGAGLPLTHDTPLPPDAPARMKDAVAKYPIAVQALWAALRSTDHSPNAVSGTQLSSR